MKKIYALLVAFNLLPFFIFAQIQIKLADITDAQPGTRVHVPVTVTGMAAGTGQSIIAVDFRFLCDSAVATFDTLDNACAQAPISQWVSGSINQSIRANWIEANLNPVNIDDNTVMIEFVLNYKGGNSTLVFEPECEVIGSDFNVIETVQYVSGSITQASGSGSTLWNGTGYWSNATDWSNGVPGDSTDAEIVTGQVNIASAAVCRNLTLAAGSSLVIKPGYSLTVNDDLDNQGTILVEADSVLTGSLIIGGTMVQTGSTIVERDVVAGQTYGIGSVVTSGPASVYTSAGSLRAFSESQNSFAAFTGTGLTDGDGYQFIPNADATLNITGKPVIADQAKALPYTAGTSESVSGWNLLANPFTSSFNCNSGLALTNTDKAIYAWNNGRYLVWNGTTGSLPGGIIPSGCAFFVKAGSTGGQATLKKEGKQHSFGYFEGTINASATILPLTVTDFDQTGLTDMAFVQLDDNANFSFDKQLDAWKLSNADNMPELYLIGDNGIKLSIAAIPFAPETVKLGFKAPVAGAYTLSADAYAFNPGSPVQLYDKVLDAVKDLRTGNHSFQSDAGTFNDRFELILSGVGINETEATADFAVYALQGNILVKSINATSPASVISVMDVSGRVLSEKVFNCAPGNSLTLPSSNGIRIVTIRTANTVSTFKVVVL